MKRSSPISLVGTPAAAVRTLWLWWMLFPVSLSEAHRAKWTYNVCDRKDMPTVVLAKDKSTGIFTVLQRYEPGEQVPPLNEWALDPRSRQLERGDYNSIPFSSSKGQEGGLRSRQVNGHFPGRALTDPEPSLESFNPTRDNRFLHTYPMVGDSPSSNDTLSVILEDVELFYASECTCFQKDDATFADSGTTRYCPSIVSRCVETVRSYHHRSPGDQGVVVGGGGGGPNDHLELESRVISCQNPETERTQKSLKAALYCCIASALLVLGLLDSHRGRSAMSYIPNRLTGGRWNERTVRRLLQQKRAWAFQLGRRHVIEQQRRRRRRRIMMEASSSPQDVAGDLPMGVQVDSDEEDLELWERNGKLGTQKLTSLVLSTTTYQSPPASSVLPASEDKNDDELDTDEVECSICLVPLETGDRIGKLPCRHPIHVECLKPWLQRQNACPLCKRLRIAQPRYDDTNDKSKMGRTDEVSNTRSTEGSFRTNDLIRDSEEEAYSVQGLETVDPVVHVEDDQSTEQLEGAIVPSGNRNGIRLQSDQGGVQEDDGLRSP